MFLLRTQLPPSPLSPTVIQCGQWGSSVGQCGPECVTVGGDGVSGVMI